MEDQRDGTEEVANREAALAEQATEASQPEMYANFYAIHHLAGRRTAVEFIMGLRAADRDPTTMDFVIEQTEGQLLNHKLIRCHDGKGDTVLINPAHVVMTTFAERLEPGRHYHHH